MQTKTKRLHSYSSHLSQMQSNENLLHQQGKRWAMIKSHKRVHVKWMNWTHNKHDMVGRRLSGFTFITRLS